MDLVHTPKAAGLFSAAISQSGPGMLMPLVRQYIPPADYGKRFLTEALNCKDIDDKDKVMQCLRDAPLYKIMEGTRMFEKYAFTPGVYRPVVDLEFSKDPMLPYNRYSNIKGGHHNKVPILMGGNKDEGAFVTVQFMTNQTKFDVVAEDALSHIPVLLFGTDEGQKLLPASVVRVWELLRFYRPETEEEREAEELGLGGHFSRKNWKQVKNMFTDMLFLAPIDQTARSTAKSQEEPVFYYNYRHV